MSFVTFVLLGLIAALFLGNLALQLTKKKKEIPLLGAEDAGFFLGSGQPAKDGLSGGDTLFGARFDALNGKVLMAHERLQRIEEALSEFGNHPAPQQQFSNPQDFSALSRRIETLRDFKLNAEIEIAAIKDVLREKGIMPPLKTNNGGQRMHKQSNLELSEAERRAHDLVFRASKK